MDSHLFNRVTPGDLFERLDSEYYSTDLMNNEDKLSSFKQVALKNVVDNSVPNNISDLTSNGSFEFLRGIEFNTNSGIPFIRTQNLMDNYLSDDEYLFVSLNSSEKVKKSLCGTGDLIVCRKGKVGSASSVPPRLQGAAISENITRFVLGKGRDADFISVFLNSRHGRKRFLREATGVIQKWINNEKLREIKIIDANNTVQKYIGDKARQAECLREWAKQLRANVDSVLNNLVLPINAKPSKYKFTKVSILEDRLDPRPYRSNMVDLVNKIETLEHDKLFSLVTFSSGLSVSSNDFIEDNYAVPLVRIRNISADGFIGLDTGISNLIHDEAANYQAEEGMIVLGMDGNFRAQFFINEELPMLVNQRVAMLKAKGMRPELLTHWLNRPEGQIQLNQWAVKTTVEHTSLTDIAKVLIPRLNENKETELANKLLNARYSIRFSKKLTNLAKILVEELIEGRVSEAELVANQQALDAGDDSLDRALVERITTNGIDNESSPLFEDIDQLYDLLTQADEAMQEA